MVLVSACDVKAALDAVQLHCASNDRLLTDAAGCQSTMTVFHSATVPGFDLSRLNDALTHPAWNLTADTTAMALALMQRFEAVTGTLVTSHMMHRIFIAATVVACKTHLDQRPSMAAFSHACGSPPAELAALELALIKALDWRLLVTADDVRAVLRTTVPAHYHHHHAVAHMPQPHFQMPLSPCVEHDAMALRGNPFRRPSARGIRRPHPSRGAQQWCHSAQYHRQAVRPRRGNASPSTAPAAADCSGTSAAGLYLPLDTVPSCDALLGHHGTHHRFRGDQQPAFDGFNASTSATHQPQLDAFAPCEVFASISSPVLVSPFPPHF
jgi:hypothetical protein